MNPYSSGTFCRISLGVKSGAQVFFLKSNAGEEAEITLLAEDTQRANSLGIYNESGLIVGYSNLPSASERPEFYAYDALCPNCYEANAATRFAPLQMEDVAFGQCRCTACGRTYNLNTGGNIATGSGGKQLYRYHAETSGPNGYLKVYN